MNPILQQAIDLKTKLSKDKDFKEVSRLMSGVIGGIKIVIKNKGKSKCDICGPPPEGFGDKSTICPKCGKVWDSN